MYIFLKSSVFLFLFVCLFVFCLVIKRQIYLNEFSAISIWAIAKRIHPNIHQEHKIIGNACVKEELKST